MNPLRAAIFGAANTGDGCAEVAGVVISGGDDAVEAVRATDAVNEASPSGGDFNTSDKVNADAISVGVDGFEVDGGNG